MSKTILDKELKKTFKPEFLNRIDKTIYFDKLSNDNLKNIIKLEIKNVGEKVNNMGYTLSDDIIESELIEKIYNNIQNESQFGARPILRQIQDNLENVITEYILDNDIEDGHIFTYKELFG